MSHECTQPRTGKVRKPYPTKAAARAAAKYYKRRFGSEQVPYHCEACERWHLARRENHTPCSPCTDCTSSDGSRKMAYQTEEGAERRGRIIERRSPGCILRVYECPWRPAGT